MPGLSRVQQNLRAEMKRQGVSIRGLADRAGMSFGFIGSVLQGKHSIGVDKLERIADALDVDIRNFFDPPKTLSA